MNKLFESENHDGLELFSHETREGGIQIIINIAWDDFRTYKDYRVSRYVIYCVNIPSRLHSAQRM